MKKVLVICASLIAMNAFAVASDEGKAEQKTDTYPLTTCVVSDEPLDSMGNAVIFSYEGREVRFCCKDCKKDFLKDPEKYLKMLDEAAAKKQAGGETSAAEKTAAEGHEEHHE